MLGKNMASMNLVTFSRLYSGIQLMASFLTQLAVYQSLLTPNQPSCWFAVARYVEPNGQNEHRSEIVFDLSAKTMASTHSSCIIKEPPQLVSINLAKLHLSLPHLGAHCSVAI